VAVEGTETHGEPGLFSGLIWRGGRAGATRVSAIIAQPFGHGSTSIGHACGHVHQAGSRDAAVSPGPRSAVKLWAFSDVGRPD
jgi:hypothetical protein